MCSTDKSNKHLRKWCIYLCNYKRFVSKIERIFIEMDLVVLVCGTQSNLSMFCGYEDAMFSTGLDGVLCLGVCATSLMLHVCVLPDLFFLILLLVSSDDIEVSVELQTI